MLEPLLDPKPESYPNYADAALAPPPAEELGPNLLMHLDRSFNRPQGGAIRWAAAHFVGGGQKCPFTLVQGPPGTGKTHTVWGLLNVLHFVQFQRYYSSLMRLLAPEACEERDQILEASNRCDARILIFIKSLKP
eukprot:2861873-Pyramimonas_sp.AAC.1